MPKLTHVDAGGDAHMVDVGGKAVTTRLAVAEGWAQLSGEAALAVRERHPRVGRAKGDVLAIAQLAGIQAAKRTSDLIPLCHPLPLDGVDVDVTLDEATCRVIVRATARATWRTGVEMEALTAVTGALLTVYDMLKAVDRGIELGGVRLVEKRGGKSGAWTRA